MDNKKTLIVGAGDSTGMKKAIATAANNNIDLEIMNPYVNTGFNDDILENIGTGTIPDPYILQQSRYLRQDKMKTPKYTDHSKKTKAARKKNKAARKSRRKNKK